MATGSNALLTTMTILQQTIGGLQQTVSSLMAQQQHTKSSTGFTLKSYYPGQTTTSAARQPSAVGTGDIHHLTSLPLRSHVVAPEQLPHMKLIADSVRKQIIEGKDVNLACLLIPFYEIPANDDKAKLVQDTRLKRTLSITEFITAFGRYKRTMCSAYPNLLTDEMRWICMKHLSFP